jgi:hypothetical protein
MGLSKEHVVAMLFSKVNKRRCQKIQKKSWDNARETLDLAQSVAHASVRGKECHVTNSTYAWYGHRKDPIGITLGPRETLDLAQSVAHANVRGKECHVTHSTYVWYGHQKDPIGITLGRYSRFPNISYNIKEKLHEKIGNIAVALKDSSRSVVYSMQSSNTLLDVKDKYQILEVFDHKYLDKKTARRGYVTQFCVEMNYWSSVRIDEYFYYTTLS